MVPDKFNIVDFGGFDLAGQYGQALPGIYDKIVGAHWNCMYIMCFGLKFADFDIAPQFMIPTMHTDHIELNGIISIDQNDVITIPSIAPPAPDPVILPGIFEENGTFSPPSGVDGYAPVTVNVSSGSADPVLPSDYQEVEYLIFDGYEWMTVNDTPADFVYTGVAKHTGNSNRSRLIGYRLTSSTNALDFDLSLSGTAISAYVRSSSIPRTAKVLNISEDSVCSTWAVFFGLRTTFFICKYYNETDSGAGLPFEGQNYGFSLYDPATMSKVMKFVPCYRKVDGEIGFYEVFNGIFYPNEGTGSLGKGPDVN